MGGSPTSAGPYATNTIYTDMGFVYICILNGVIRLFTMGMSVPGNYLKLDFEVGFCSLDLVCRNGVFCCC